MFHVPEEYRIVTGNMKSDSTYGNNGAFKLPPVIGNRRFFVIASDGMGWEHVSVHCFDGNKNRTPAWDEMCHIKDIFWDEEDVVMQLHPRKSQYVNIHENTLHLWRPIGAMIPEPIPIMVG